MRRKALLALKEWKDDPDRKPLILKGARQVGKTWLMERFGEECYEDSFYFKMVMRIHNVSKPEHSLNAYEEVKAGGSTHANSFKKYIAERKPKKALRISGLGYVEQECMINIPLYLVGKAKELIS